MDKQEFTKYLESKDYAPTTQKEYVLRVELFLKWLKKEDLQIAKTDILDYLEYLKNQKNNNNPTRTTTLIAIKHYFAYLIENDYIAKNPAASLKLRGTQIKKLHDTYTNDELDELYDNFYQVYIRDFETCKYYGKATVEYMKLKREKNLAALGILIYQGILTNELKYIKLSDIDLQKAKIKIPSSRQAHERILPLNASQIGILINYVQNIRPQLIAKYQKTSETDLLFHLENMNAKDTVSHLTTMTRKIDRKFRNFRQIRASVIVNWLKTEGLRKAQYLAGHRSIQATERYTPNNLESLIEDIAKHHPLNF